jgi:hypothetical protein
MRKSVFAALTIIAIPALFFGYWLVSSNPKEKEPLSIEASTLMAEYLENIVSEVDKKYKDKQMKVSGKIYSVRHDQGVVVLQGVFPHPAYNVVECYVPAQDRANFNELAENQPIVVQGRHAGWDFGSVRLHGCRVIAR